jgi:hypothetical protein
VLQFHVDRLSSVVEHLTSLVQILFSALLSYPKSSQVFFSGANTLSRKVTTNSLFVVSLSVSGLV